MIAFVNIVRSDIKLNIKKTIPRKYNSTLALNKFDNTFILLMNESKSLDLTNFFA